MSQQQTVLRVKTTKVKDTFVGSGNLTFDSASNYGMNVSGSGTTINPFNLSTYKENPSMSHAVGIARFPFTTGQGLVRYEVYGEPDKLSNVKILYNGDVTNSYILDDKYNNFTGRVLVNSGDIIQVTLNGDDAIGNLTFEATPVNTYEDLKLDLFSDIPIKLTKSFSEYQDIAKKNSDYSIGLKLPGSKKNNRFFEDYYNVDMSRVYFDPSKRVECEILVDDAIYFKGYLKLNNISVKNSQNEYDVTLYSTVGNLFGQIGNNLLRDLDFEDAYHRMNHIFSLDKVTETWDRSNATYFGEPHHYMYPIIHNGYQYDGNEINFSGGTLDTQTRFFTPTTPIGSYDNLTNFTNAGGTLYRINSPTNNGLIDHQLKPALSVYHLFKLIFKNYGYTIKSDFFKTPWFKNLYMYGFYNDNNAKFTYTVEGLQTVNATDVEFVRTEDVIYYLENVCGINYATYLKTQYFTLVLKGTGRRVITDQPVTITTTYFGLECDGKFFGRPVTITIPAGENVGTHQYHQQRFVTCPGDSCPSVAINYTIYEGVSPTSQIKESPIGSVIEDGTSDVAVTEGTEVRFQNIIDEKLKQIDFLSSIAKKFDLVFLDDPDVPNQYIIEPYDYYVGKGEVYDWSDKLSYDEGFTVKPSVADFPSVINLYDLDDGDAGNQEYLQRYGITYGKNIVNNVTDFTTSEKDIKTIFSSMVFRKWDDDDGTDEDLIGLPLGMSYSSSSSESDSGNSKQAYFKYEGVKTKPKLFYWSGSGNPFIDSPSEVYDYTKPYKSYTINLRASNSVLYSENTSIPIISSSSSIGNTDSSDNLSILFKSEKPLYVDVEQFDTFTEYNLYDVFYKNRIQNMYDPETRIVKGKFNLNIADINALRPNDLIKIKEQYFTWNKINGFDYTNNTLTEVELVQYTKKAKDYPVRYFQYYYGSDTGNKYNIKTDFLADQMYYGNYYFSTQYDYYTSLLSGATSYTTSFLRGSEYLPYTMTEITENEYNTTGIDFAYDSYLKGITGFSESLFYAIVPTQWYGTTMTGVNLFTDYSDFSNKSFLYGIPEATVPTPLPTGTPTPSPTPTPTPIDPDIKGSLMIDLNL